MDGVKWRGAIRKPEESKAFTYVCAEPVVDTRTGVLAKIELTLCYGGKGRLEHPVQHAAGDLWSSPLLEQACAFITAFGNRRGEEVRLGLVVSPTQAVDRAFSQDLRVILSRTGLDPKLLELSLSERTLMGVSSETTRKLRALRSLNVSLALRGFGEGAAPLQLFERFEFSSVQLAAQLIARLKQPLRQPHYPVAVVSCVVEMARLLDFEVVVSGVTTFEQAHVLKSLGCDMQQGPFYAIPIMLTQVDVRRALEAAWIELL